MNARVSVSTRHLARAIPNAVRTLARVLHDAGFRSWAVGGSVRDHLLLELSPDRAVSTKSDWDVATDARPEQVQKLFRRVIPTGIQHGTVTVVLDKQSFEVTTLRGETTYSDGRHPDGVYFVDDLNDDLARRDFTVNAIAYDVLADRLFDPFGGIFDLEARLLRAVGEPRERFGEDGLRVLRCARFAATLEMNVEPRTRSAMRPSLDSYRKVSAERIRDEWWKAFGAARPSRAFELMRDEGLLEVTAPELFALASRHVPGLRDDVLTHAFRTLDELPHDPVLRLAGLLHPLALTPEGDPWPAESSRRASALGARLRLSNTDRERLTALVRHHVLPTVVPEGGALRRYLRDVTPELWPDVLALLRAHVTASGDDPDEAARLAELERQCQDELGRAPALSLKELAVSGKDLITEGVVAPGPALGRTLNTLLELVLDDPATNTRDALLARARELGGAP